MVIRYEGPKGGPGMREMLSPTSRDHRRRTRRRGRPDHRRPLLGGTFGMVVGHVAPEADDRRNDCAGPRGRSASPSTPSSAPAHARSLRGRNRRAPPGGAGFAPDAALSAGACWPSTPGWCRSASSGCRDRPAGSGVRRCASPFDSGLRSSVVSSRQFGGQWSIDRQKRNGAPPRPPPFFFPGVIHSRPGLMPIDI